MKRSILTILIFVMGISAGFAQEGSENPNQQLDKQKAEKMITSTVDIEKGNLHLSDLSSKIKAIGKKHGVRVNVFYPEGEDFYINVKNSGSISLGSLLLTFAKLKMDQLSFHMVCLKGYMDCENILLRQNYIVIGGDMTLIIEESKQLKELKQKAEVKLKKPEIILQCYKIDDSFGSNDIERLLWTITAGVKMSFGQTIKGGEGSYTELPSEFKFRYVRESRILMVSGTQKMIDYTDLVYSKLKK